ncbi:MAG: extracellular solute-binding protein [Firmicutes bacterium]|nr:extracellular solute-binding protein [Bacillota bacterium]
MLSNTTGSSGETSAGTKNIQNSQEVPKPITFTYFRGQSNNVDPYPDNEFARYVKENTGVTIEVEDVIGDLDTKIGVMIASNSYTDFLYGVDRHYKFIDAGACVPMNQYIEKFGENTKKVYAGHMNDIKWDDGNVYFLSPTREDAKLREPDAAMYIQKAILKEFGWPRVETVDDYFNLLIKYKEKYPEIDGNTTIPFSIVTDSWRIFTLYNPTRYLSGRDNNALDVDDETLECRVPVAEDWQKRWYLKLNELYNMGHLDKECFSMTYDKYIEKLSTGRVLGMHDYYWQILPAQNSLVQQGKTDRFFVPLPITWDESIEEHYMDAPTFGNREGVSISISCKDPERAFKFIDWLLSEEVQKRIYWGIKDKNYFVDEKGKYYIKHDNQTTEVQAAQLEAERRDGRSLFYYPWPRGATSQLYSDGNPWSPLGSRDEVYADYKDYEREFLDAYNLKTYTDMFNAPKKRPFGYLWLFSIPSDSEANLINIKMSEIDREWITKCITAKPEDFNRLWQQYANKLKELDLSKIETWYEDTIRNYVSKHN